MNDIQIKYEVSAHRYKSNCHSQYTEKVDYKMNTQYVNDNSWLW